MLNIENIDEKNFKVVNSKSWKSFQDKFNDCNNIFVLGHGGKLAVADHAAVDISRLSNGTKMLNVLVVQLSLHHLSMILILTNGWFIG